MTLADFYTDLEGLAAWQTDAACRGADPNIFFLTKGIHAGPAKAVCATCPVIEPCRNHAVTNVEPAGVWGGLTERERRRLRK